MIHYTYIVYLRERNLKKKEKKNQPCVASDMKANLNEK